MTPRPLTVTIISCASRTEARAATIPQLRAGTGSEPLVFLSPCDASRPAGPIENARVSHAAHQAAIAAGGDWLFCEDDIDLAPDFPTFLNLARRADRVTYLYLHDNERRMDARYGEALARAILTRQVITAGLIEPGNVRQLRGAQCVYIPRSFLNLISSDAFLQQQSAVDVWLARTLDEMRIQPLAAIPHPVQHRQDRTARKPPHVKSPDKYSLSYPLERRWTA